MRDGNGRDGFAMLEAMAAVMIFMVIGSVLCSAALAMERQAIRRVERNEAYDAALAAVRIMAGEVVDGSLDSAAGILISEGGMEKTETELVVTPKDGSEPFSVLVTVWSEWDGETLILYGESAVGGQSAAVSLTMRRQRMTDSDAGTNGWVLVRYGNVWARKEQE